MSSLLATLHLGISIAVFWRMWGEWGFWWGVLCGLGWEIWIIVKLTNTYVIPWLLR